LITVNPPDDPNTSPALCSPRNLTPVTYRILRSGRGWPGGGGAGILVHNLRPAAARVTWWLERSGNAVNNPTCPRCGHVFAWRDALRQVLGPSRAGAALWGAVCPSCGTDLRVPMTRVLLIAAAGIFFGSQSSTLLLVGDLSTTEFWLIKLLLIIGFYAIAIFFFLKLEVVE
jgi:hypothetical protein